MADLAVSGVTPQVAVDKTKFTGRHDGGPGIGTAVVAGAAAGGIKYALGSVPTASGLLKLKDQAVTDTYTKLDNAAAKITDAAKKTEAEGAIATVKAELEKVAKAATPEAAEAAKTTIKTTLEEAAKKLPKIKSVGGAVKFGAIVAAGVYVISKLFGGHKEA